VKFNLEIPIDEEYEGTVGFATYDLITAQGNTLDELLDNAVVSAVDQDGGELRGSPFPADEEWMQTLVTEALYDHLIGEASKLEDGMTGFARCMKTYCEQNGIDQDLGRQAVEYWEKHEAIAAGIPKSVVDGKAKLSDHFSAEYIMSQRNPRGDS
jgi:hypothetical protein